MAKNSYKANVNQYANQEEAIRKAKGNPNKNIHSKKKNSNYGGYTTGAYMAHKVAETVGKQERVKRVVWDATLLGAAFAVVWILLFQLFPHQIFSIFSNDPAVIEMAPPFMTVCSINMLAAALMSPTMGLINGVGDTLYNMIVAIADGVAARLVLSLLLGFTAGMGALGFYLGNCLAGFVSVLGGGIYFLAGWWKKKGSLVRHE